MEPWPFDSTKRSRLIQCGLAGMCDRWRDHSATAMSAMPIGAPGCPELAAWTASIASARMALAIRVGMVAATGVVAVTTFEISDMDDSFWGPGFGGAEPAILDG